MKSRYRMGVRGSVTILLMLMMPMWLFLGGVTLDRATFFHAYQSFVRENELRLAGEFRAFDRDLFDRYGLLGVKVRHSNVQYMQSLGEGEYLENAIVSLMRHRAVNDLTIMGAESLFSDHFIGDILEIREEVNETIALKDAINRMISRGEVPESSDLERLFTAVMRNIAYYEYPYQDFHEILSLTGQAIIKLEISHVLKDMEWEYFDSFAQMELDSISEKYLLSAYALDYLGYSSNRLKREIFTAEYVLTGLPIVELQRPIIQSELVMVRTIMNGASLIGDAEKMREYLILSGGDVKLQLIYLLADALKMGIQDMNLLMEGRPVPLYKSPMQLDQKTFRKGLYYKDYLAILLMVVPRDMLLYMIILFPLSEITFNQFEEHLHALLIESINKAMEAEDLIDFIEGEELIEMTSISWQGSELSIELKFREIRSRIWRIRYPFSRIPFEKLIYVTDTGLRYHLFGCVYLRESLIPLVYSRALLQYKPCKVCSMNR